MAGSGLLLVGGAVIASGLVLSKLMAKEKVLEGEVIEIDVDGGGQAPRGTEVILVVQPGEKEGEVLVVEPDEGEQDSGMVIVVEPDTDMALVTEEEMAEIGPSPDLELDVESINTDTVRFTEEVLGRLSSRVAVVYLIHNPGTESAVVSFELVEASELVSHIGAGTTTVRPGATVRAEVKVTFVVEPGTVRLRVNVNADLGDARQQEMLGPIISWQNVQLSELEPAPDPLFDVGEIVWLAPIGEGTQFEVLKRQFERIQPNVWEYFIIDTAGTGGGFWNQEENMRGPVALKTSTVEFSETSVEEEVVAEEPVKVDPPPHDPAKVVTRDGTPVNLTAQQHARLLASGLDPSKLTFTQLLDAIAPP